MNSEPNRSLGEIHRGERLPIVLLLFLSLALFLTGLLRPFTRIIELWLFDNHVSVYQGLIALFKEQGIFLFGMLLIYAVTFPFVKIAALLALWLTPGLRAQTMARVHDLVSNMSTWSMLDVCVVAVLLVLTPIVSEWTGRIAKRTLARAE